MTDNNEELLRKSLNAVDRHRNRLLIGLAAGIALLIYAFISLTGSFREHPSNIMMAHNLFVVVSIWTTLLALVIVIQITVMTKRILRAIELASKR